MPTSINSGTDSDRSLAGNWGYQLDPERVGEAEAWYARELGGEIRLPGSLPGAGIGDAVTVETPWIGSVFNPAYYTEPEYAVYREPGNIKMPFWLQPETVYAGAAWYQRSVEIPATWTGRRVTLTLERPHWKTTVWWDGKRIGSNDSLSVAHVYELGAAIGAGKHTVTIEVDNAEIVKIGENSHSISEHTQGNWNGIVGEIALRASSLGWADRVRIFPRVAERAIEVRGRLRNDTGAAVTGCVTLLVEGAGLDAVAQPFALDGAEGEFAMRVALGDAVPLWDEFSPAVQYLVVKVDLTNGPCAGEADTQRIAFGLREIGGEGNQLLINGRKLYLRGTLDCAAYPLTGHPPMDGASWREVLGTVRAHGLNHVRFHSWCPPEVAFGVADELGIYVQVEAASWPNQGTVLGEGQPVDGWLDAETERILWAYGNHPSLVIMGACNEPAGEGHEAWLEEWIRRHKARDPRPLYTAGAGWPEVAANELHIRSEPRIQHWEEGLGSRINAAEPETVSDYREFIEARTVPVVSHEIGQWCVYPNLAGIVDYTGYLKPRNFEIFRETLSAHGMADRAQEFLMASGKLQALCYKEDIESALRTPAMGGFQLLGLSDFPGQGTALVGVLDVFWRSKGYLTAEAFRRFCAPTVVLARLERRVFTTDETLVADVEVAHFGATPRRAVVGRWAIWDDAGNAAAGGNFDAVDLAIGSGNRVGRIEVRLADVPAPARYRLEVALGAVANDWDVWVYPAEVTTPETVRVIDRMDGAAQAELEAGATMIFMIPPARVAPDARRGAVALGFSSIFWNTAWTNGQAPHTLGIWCDPEHPALAAFPTDAHSNWQWWYVVRHAAAMILDGLPHALRPIVQVIDDWVTNRKLGLVWEARVGKGRLLVTSVDLRGELDPVRRQLRASLFAYAASGAFEPAVEIEAEAVSAITIPRLAGRD